MRTSRRKVLAGLGCGALSLAAQKGKPLDITEYQPKSTLAVPETAVEKAKFPVVDIHTHLSWTRDETNNFRAKPEELLAVMDRRNIRTMVNLTGGRGAGLREAIQKYDKAHPGRFITFTEPWWSRVNEPGYPKMQADAIQQAARDGARGLKVLKTLGLFLRDSGGQLVKVDDPRFDPMWEACGAAGIPVAIHVSDPVAFFNPIDRFNERFEELNNHPDWSFHGKDYPPNADLLAARDRVISRHRKTQFIVLHVGNFAENLQHVTASLQKMPNMHVEIGARIGELGRQPRTARKFFDRWQDRILFGTDAVPHGVETPQQVFGDDLYRIYYRFLETEDEYFDYAPAPVPPQGRWRIYGLGLPDQILRKVYHGNADRLLKVKA
ncbi:MAG TPA: amidohydrolase family protein [Bryobacteraceae bacterium]|nr:amidohydrolase family protein [Bryobacteraceae bacterium]